MIDSDHQARIAINTATILGVDVVITIAVVGSTGETSLAYTGPSVMADEDVRTILRMAADQMPLRRAPDA